MKEVFKEIFAQISLKDALSIGIIFLLMFIGVFGTLYLCK